MRAKTLAAVLTGGAFLGTVAIADRGHASSHMDAPLITFDDPANTTDVYAFRSESEDKKTQYLTTALAVYPFEEPGIGPNNYRFDDRVRYEIHVALGDDIAAGEKTISYQFDFETSFQDGRTIRQAYLEEVIVDNGKFDGQNLTQTYTVTKVDHRTKRSSVLGTGIPVPPNNQGLVTPLYNLAAANGILAGDMPARDGVTEEADLDAYTATAIRELDGGYRAFAGQRDDGFYADIQSIFDLDFSFGRFGEDEFVSPAKPFDSQGGFNLHTIVLNIPLSELDDAKIAGVYATTSRRQITRLSRDFEDKNDGIKGDFVQVGRQGNPLFAEALIALEDKDLYNRVDPTRDDDLFAQYAEDPEVSRLLGVVEIIPGLLRQIYIPDLIKVDLTTGPALLAGQEADGFNRLGVFGGDVLESAFQDPFNNGGFIPGGWPNGRRFGDDVVDIALIALGAAGAADPSQPGFGFTGVEIDGITENDITFNQVFPYAATPLNGRNHGHHGDPAKVF